VQLNNGRTYRVCQVGSIGLGYICTCTCGHLDADGHMHMRVVPSSSVAEKDNGAARAHTRHGARIGGPHRPQSLGWTDGWIALIELRRARKAPGHTSSFRARDYPLLVVALDRVL
jgi:hypothetical protein